MGVWLLKDSIGAPFAKQDRLTRTKLTSLDVFILFLHKDIDAKSLCNTHSIQTQRSMHLAAI